MCSVHFSFSFLFLLLFHCYNVELMERHPLDLPRQQVEEENKERQSCAFFFLTFSKGIRRQGEPDSSAIAQSCLRFPMQCVSPQYRYVCKRFSYALFFPLRFEIPSFLSNLLFCSLLQQAARVNRSAILDSPQEQC